MITITARIAIAACACAALSAACTKAPAHRTFATPEDAVRTLTAAVKAGNIDEVVAIFGPEGKALIDSSDPAMARRNRQIFTAAVNERWRLDAVGNASRVLVIGNEDWPFPVPLVKDGDSWRFDTAAGKEEVLARRIGRNELAAIFICRAYVAAQRLYAARAHDGQPAGRYATKFKSDPGLHNGLYWPSSHLEKPSPLGDLLARAAEDSRQTAGGNGPSPFHGYLFRILPASGGFGLIAWPAEYDSTGVMTFVVNQDATVREKDLGADTDRSAREMTGFNPDDSWTAVTASRSQ
jgi:hypothetical protein